MINIVSVLQGKVVGLLRDLSNIDSTDQEYAISNMQLGATTVINLYTDLELCRIPPDFPLPACAFLSEMDFIKIWFLLAKVYGNIEQRLLQIDTCNCACLIRVTMSGLLVLQDIF